MILAAAGCPVALYSPGQDRAVSFAGSELRKSLADAMAPPRPSRVEEIIDKVSRAILKAMDDEGVQVSSETFGRLFEVFAILPSEIPLPEVVVESERSVGLDWQEGRRRVLTLTIDDSPSLGFVALFGHEPLHGRVPFAGAIPETLAYLFSRLYPVAYASR